LLISAQFLHKELPIRIARRAIELDNLPYGLSQKPAVLKVNFFLYSAELWLVVNSVMYFFPIYGALGSVFIGFGG